MEQGVEEGRGVGVLDLCSRGHANIDVCFSPWMFLKWSICREAILDMLNIAQM